MVIPHHFVVCIEINSCEKRERFEGTSGRGVKALNES